PPRVELQRADVPAFAADDAPLHVVRRQVEDGHGGLDRVVRRQALDRRRENFTRLDVRDLARFLLDPHPEECGLVPRFFLHLRQELPARFLRREAGDGLQLAALLLERRGDALLRLVELLLARAELALPRDEIAVFCRELTQSPFQVLQLAGELLLLRQDPLLDLLDLALALS